MLCNAIYEDVVAKIGLKSLVVAVKMRNFLKGNIVNGIIGKLKMWRFVQTMLSVGF